MAQIVNLNAVRKKNSRLAAQIKAVENAAKFGRTKTEKDREAAQAEKARRDLDGAKRE